MSAPAHPWVSSPHATTSRPEWTTEDALLFVTCLGTWRQPPCARAPLLRRYLAACARRQDWGQIDVGQVQLRVARLLTVGEPETG